MLPDNATERVRDTQVDPNVARHDSGNFLFINLADGDPKFKIPPNRRWRVNREKMRQALITGLEDHINWGKRVVSIKHSDEDNKVQVSLQDGSLVDGSMVVGIEGSRSIVRQHLRPDAYSNQQLPVRFTGVAIHMTAAEAEPLRAMDPLLFQGCHPPSGTFFWFSVLETPELNGTAGQEYAYYRAQICMSWPYRQASDEVARTDQARLDNMKQRAQGFAPFLKHAIENIPDGTPVMEIKLADWECLQWDNASGLITLAGDAAHAMTMYRGEAANHGILDAFHLQEAIEAFYCGSMSRSEAIDQYENEMRERTSQAVLLSRQACLDAHDWSLLNKNSAILAKRAVKLK